MIAKVKARYADGVLTPLEPLALEEGKEYILSIEYEPQPDHAPPPHPTDSPSP